MRQILISRGPPCRAVVLNDGCLDDLRAWARSDIGGNIYRARVAHVEPALNAAFVDIGAERAAFLAASDVRCDAPRANAANTAPGMETRPTIAGLLQRDQEIMVQVVRAPAKQRGASVSMFVSLPGRHLVMTDAPGIAFSAGIAEGAERERLGRILNAMARPNDAGIIVRRAAVGHAAKDIDPDLRRLVLLRNEIAREFAQSAGQGPMLLYEDGDPAQRVLRELCDDGIDEIWCDDAALLSRIQGLAGRLGWSGQIRFELHGGAQTLFSRFGLEPQFLALAQREVGLPGGGRIVIERTTGLTAIDVASARIGTATGVAAQVLATNLEAAARSPASSDSGTSGASR